MTTMTTMTTAASHPFARLPCRQGDVRILPVAGIPSSASLAPRDPRGAVLQEGTATGHAHRIASPAAQILALGPARYLRVRGDEEVALQHEEHGTIPIAPGDYQIVIHHEYVPGEVPRQVED
jgi:hypothetical protein